MSELRKKATFDELIGQVAAGSDVAVWELIERYSTNILRVVRRHLPDRIRGKLDSTDVVQSVWKSLLKNPPQLDSPEAFVKYIAVMARNKVFEAHRHFTAAQAFDVRREEAAKSGAKDRRDASPSGEHAIDRRTDTPSAIARVRESWEHAASKQGERGRQVVRCRLQGMTLEETAQHLDVSRDTVRRDLQSLFASLTT